MTTATTTDAAEPHLASEQASSEFVALELLFEAPYNPRSSFEDLDELTASIQTDGVLEPLIVRDRPRARKKKVGDPYGEGQLEIIAGARRARAAKAAGLHVVPVIRLSVGDATARRICAAENLQRTDLHPLEEARTIANIVEDFGVATAAEQLGKTLRYVARRANLLDLSPKWQSAIGKKKAAASSYPVAILELVALLVHHDQDELFRQFGAGGTTGQPPSMGYLERMIGEQLRILKRATWKLEDAELVPKQGACVDCTRHTAAAVGLFEDQVAGDLATATCRDLSCWREKTTAVAARKLAAAREEHGSKMVLVAGVWEGGGLRGRRGAAKKGPLGKPALQDYEYRVVKKKTKGAVPAFVVEGKGTGSVRWISGGSSSSTRSTAKTATKKADPGTAEDLKAKRDRLQRRRDGFSVDWIRELLEASEAAPRELAVLAPLFLAYGVPEASRGGSWRTTEFAGRKKAAEEYALDQLWIALRGRLVSSITRHASGALAVQLKEAHWFLGQLWPVTAKKTLASLAKLAEEKIPKPKALEALERRGTKKVTKKKKVARRGVPGGEKMPGRPDLEGKKKASSRGPRAVKKKPKKKGRRSRKD